VNTLNKNTEVLIAVTKTVGLEMAQMLRIQSIGICSRLLSYTQQNVKTQRQLRHSFKMRDFRIPPRSK